MQVSSEDVSQSALCHAFFMPFLKSLSIFKSKPTKIGCHCSLVPMGSRMVFIQVAYGEIDLIV